MWMLSVKTACFYARWSIYHLERMTPMILGASGTMSRSLSSLSWSGLECVISRDARQITPVTRLRLKWLKERMLEMTEEHQPSKSKGFTDSVMQLIKAAEQGDTQVMESLLNKDPSLALAREPVQGHHGVTALHKAKNAKTAQMLLDHGADPNARDVGHDSTPLTWATAESDRDPEVIDVLLAGGAEVTDIYVAARLGDLDKVREFLDRDASLASAMCDFPNLWGGCTALHIAVIVRHEDIVRLLVTERADPEKRRVIPPDGDQAYALTALEMAKGKKEMLELLEDQGAKG